MILTPSLGLFASFSLVACGLTWKWSWQRGWPAARAGRALLTYSSPCTALLLTALARRPKRRAAAHFRHVRPTGDSVRARVASAVTASFLAAACSDIAGPSLTVSVDRSSYAASPEFAGSPFFQFHVIATYTNSGTRPALLSRCMPDSPRPIYSVFATKGPSAYTGAWACPGPVPPFTVPPGATRVDTFTVIGPSMVDGATKQPLGKLEGDFYLLVEGAPSLRSPDF